MIAVTIVKVACAVFYECVVVKPMKWFAELQNGMTGELHGPSRVEVHGLRKHSCVLLLPSVQTIC